MLPMEEHSSREGTRWHGVVPDQWPLYAVSAVALCMLGVFVNTGIHRFLDRAHGPLPAEVAQLAQLNCIERTVDSQTTSGEIVNVVVNSANANYLYQRFVDLEVPRLTVDTSPARVVIMLADSKDGSSGCGGVTVSVHSTS